MWSYLISFAVGLGVGGLYALLRVASPAPPLVALIGLLGIVLGEQAIGRLTRPRTTADTQVASPALLESHARELEPRGGGSAVARRSGEYNKSSS